ncbi:hypothetical protein AB0H49_34010 [Nocardia sp. NPDC050713]|uniref:hypothetical protein n=1 Tax=Nocardia sp. NPDC050713 TaxID=3154511 RepID=UPI0033E07A6C
MSRLDVVQELALDMEAAAVEAGDQAPAGAGRRFAAQRAHLAAALIEMTEEE